MAQKKEKPKFNNDYERDKDAELVEGVFRYYEVPQGYLEFNYRKYKGEKVEYYKLWDEVTYKIPLGVAKHLNKNGWYPIHSYAQDANGLSSQRISQKVRRFGFHSLEFIQDEDLSEVGSSKLVTVENVLI